MPTYPYIFMLGTTDLVISNELRRNTTQMTDVQLYQMNVTEENIALDNLLFFHTYKSKQVEMNECLRICNLTISKDRIPFQSKHCICIYPASTRAIWNSVFYFFLQCTLLYCFNFINLFIFILIHTAYRTF